MAYSDDLNATSPDFRWELATDSNSDVGSLNGTNTSIAFTGLQLCLDSATSAQTNSDNDSIQFGQTANIDDEVNHLMIAGWFQPSAIQQPSCRIAGDGNTTSSISMMLGFGNTVLFEVDPAGDIVQVVGALTLTANRAYHLAVEMEDTGANIVLRGYIDGILQGTATSTTATMPARGAGLRLGGTTSGTLVSIGGSAFELVSVKNGNYSQWCTWSDANVPTQATLQADVFAKGAIASVTLADLDGTETLLNQSYGDVPLAIRIDSTQANCTLTLDNTTFAERTSLHIQWMGTGTLTVINANGSNGSKAVATGGGSVAFVEAVPITVTVLDAATLSPVQGALVRLEADLGGPLPVGSVIEQGTSDVSGLVTGSLQYSADQPYILKARKATNSPRYRPAQSGGTITSNGLTTTILLVGDE